MSQAADPAAEGGQQPPFIFYGGDYISKRVLAMALAILAFFIFVGSPFQHAAQAVAVVDDVLIAIIIAALAAMGITFAITGGYVTAEEWVADMINDSGISFSGSKYGANSAGSILLNNRFVRSISLLADYIKARYSLVDNSSKVIQNSSINAGSLMGVSLPFYSHLDKFQLRNFYFVSGNSPVLGFAVKTGDADLCDLVFYATEPFSVTRYWYADGQSMESGSTTNFTAYENNGYYVTASIGSARVRDVPIVYDSRQYVIDALNENSDVSTNGGITANTGVIDIPDDATIGDKGGILTLPLPWGLTIWDILSKIPGLVLDDELTGEAELELEEESAVEEQIDQAATQQPISSNPEDYQAPGLQSVFPFCIPFDIYAFFECLAADPVAPSFTWRFYIPGICDEDLEIDLAPFDSAARILRTMELLLFIVGLAFVTRDKFLRG